MKTITLFLFLTLPSVSHASGFVNAYGEAACRIDSRNDADCEDALETAKQQAIEGAIEECNGPVSTPKTREWHLRTESSVIDGTRSTRIYAWAVFPCE